MFLAIMPAFLALLAPYSCAFAQTSSDDFRQTLLNAERAIMDDLSAQAIGASPSKVAMKAPAPAPQPKPQPQQAAKQPAKPPLAAKKAPAPKPEVVKAIAAPKPELKPTLAPQAPTEAELKAASLTRENDSLRKQLESLRAQLSKAESELQSTRNELTVAETEVSRLSTLVDAKTRASLGRYNVSMPAAPAPQAAPRAAAVQPAAQPAPKPAEDVKPPSRSTDMQIATITVDKADLRVGPGKNNSALMTLRRGSRLAVEERQGEWYRVFAPNGQRAWIQSSLVSFGDGASNMNDGSAVRVKGFSPNAEEEAFRRLQKMSGK